MDSILKKLSDPRRWWAVAMVILLLGAAWTWTSRVTTPGGTGVVASPHAGFLAPDFTLKTLDGQALSLSSLRGQVVILNLWASWCGPCRFEMPTIQRVYAAERNRGLTVVAVNGTFQDSESSASAFARQYGLTFPIVLDRDGSVSRTYLLRALPSTFIIDRRGIVRSVILGGPIAEALLRSNVEPWLQAAP